MTSSGVSSLLHHLTSSKWRQLPLIACQLVSAEEEEREGSWTAMLSRKIDVGGGGCALEAWAPEHGEHPLNGPLHLHHNTQSWRNGGWKMTWNTQLHNRNSGSSPLYVSVSHWIGSLQLLCLRCHKYSFIGLIIIHSINEKTKTKWNNLMVARELWT